MKIKDKERKLRRTRQVYNLFQDLWNKPFWVSKQLKRENGFYFKHHNFFFLFLTLSNRYHSPEWNSNLGHKAFHISFERYYTAP